MNTYQIAWLIVLIPLMLIYAINEIRRGWNIKFHNKPSLNFALLLRIKVIELLKGKVVADEYKEKLLNDMKEMNSLAFYSIFGGVITIIIVFIWIAVLLKVFPK